MASISGQLEELYLAHSRKDMNDTVTGVLLSACAPGAAMPGRLVMEHVLLLSILHHTVGVEVGPPPHARSGPPSTQSHGRLCGRVLLCVYHVGTTSPNTGLRVRPVAVPSSLWFARE